MQQHGFDSVLGRQFFSIYLPTAVPLPELNLPPGNFACLLAWDSRGVSVQSIVDFVEPLLRAGASYFVCWGPNCETLHDIIDQVASHPDNNFGIPEDSCIMTTWHSHEPLQDAIFYFLVSAIPDEPYVDSTRVGLAITVDSPAWASEIAVALDEPRKFVGNRGR